MEIERESIFVSALRSFCRMFFSVCGIVLALLLMSVVYSTVSGSTGATDLTTKIKYLPDANDKKELVAPTAPVLLQLNIHGVIGDPKGLDSETIANILVDSRAATLKNDRVKGILLHINSPGGAAVDSDSIYRMLMDYKARYKVPVFAYVEGLCASGGMYIACAADKIYSGPSGVIGSVGVVLGPFFNVNETLQKMGVLSRTLTQGLDKDMMSPFRPWKENEDASLTNVMSYLYEQFVSVVASSRPNMDKNKLINEYGAQVFNPVDAQKFGYVDEINSSRNATLLALMQEAHIDPAGAYQVIELEPKSELIANLFNAKSPLLSGKMEHTLDLGVPRFKDRFAYYYQPAD